MILRIAGAAVQIRVESDLYFLNSREEQEGLSPTADEKCGQAIHFRNPNLRTVSRQSDEIVQAKFSIAS